jgi:hypothetical protein
LTNSAGGCFAIGSGTGVVTVANASLLDFETTTSHGITVQATSADGSSSTQDFTIAVTDVVENTAPTITSDGAGATAAIALAENIAAVTDVNASDFSDTEGAGLSYSVVLPGNGGAADGALFTIDAATGALAFASAPDFEAPADAGAEIGNNTYQVTVRVTDSGGLTDDQTITVTVTDADEFDVTAPYDADGPSGGSVAENAANGATVGVTATASDADGATNAVIYSLIDNAGGRFAIDSSTGVVTVAGVLDREAAASYGITVRATSADGSFAETAFTIGLTDVDEFDVTTPVDTDGPAGGGVAENAASGATVGITASATDADATTNTVTYSLTNSAGGRFAIGSGTGVVTVANASLLDFETTTSHGITVQATSADGSSSTQDFTIAVTDAAEGISNGNSGGVLNGTPGNDVFHGAGGVDVAVGGDGNDRFVATNGDASDVYLGGNGSDTLDMSAVTASIILDLAGAFATSSLTGLDALVSIENAIGGSIQDAITGTGAANRLDGQGGNDTINAGNGNDTVIGGAGNDSMNGGPGSDTFVFLPGFGNDRIQGFDANPAGGQDFLQFGGGITLGQIVVTDVGADTLVTAGGDTIRLVGIGNAATVTSADFLFVV